MEAPGCVSCSIISARMRVANALLKKKKKKSIHGFHGDK